MYEESSQEDGRANGIFFLPTHCRRYRQFVPKRVSILLPKLFCPTVRKYSSSDREKLLKFKAEGREFAKNLRSPEQFIQTVKDQNNFW